GLIIAPGQDFNEDRPSVMSGAYIVEKKEEDKTGSTIAWVLLLITIAIAFGLLVIKLQNEAKTRREKAEEPFPERRGRRTPPPPGRERPHGGGVERNPSGMKFK
ncbi:MAG: hypothetical protein KAH57_04255, partial [Thermoplasmata archaeon]|nr:hypothetical protein [Thermoplasmata archaeon]